VVQYITKSPVSWLISSIWRRI